MAKRSPEATSSVRLANEIRAARKRGAQLLKSQPLATCARYDPKQRLIIVCLNNGCSVSFPKQVIEGLSNASSAELGKVEISPAGTSLRWETLDLDLGVAALAAGVFGTRAWMSQLGRLGGSATSKRKAAAARLNGRKGGRPRAS